MGRCRVSAAAPRFPPDNPTMEGHVNRTELIEAVSADTGLTTKQSEAAISALVYEITAGVRSGNPVRITGFGSFKLRQRPARKGRNPQTGATVKVKASKGIGFTPGVRLKADLNSRSAPAKPSVLAAVAPPATKTARAKTAAAPAVAAKTNGTKAGAARKAPAKTAPTKKAAASSR